MNTYAGELDNEMRIYGVNRLENIRDNVNAIIKRLRSIKPKKRYHKKSTLAGKKSNKLETAKSADIYQVDATKKDDLASDDADAYTEISGPSEPPAPQLIDVIEDAHDIKDETDQKYFEIDEVMIADETASPVDTKSKLQNASHTVSVTPITPK